MQISSKQRLVFPVLLVDVFKRLKQYLLRKINRVTHTRLPSAPYSSAISAAQYAHPYENIFAGACLHELLSNYRFETVLDVGCGSGVHTRIFADHGKRCTAVDLGKSVYFAERVDGVEMLLEDFMNLSICGIYDLVWASHVLEHQLNVNAFLVRLRLAANPNNGIVAITVPPSKPEVVGGHLTIWNTGLLLYNLVLAGFDCRKARALRYGYNISVIVPRHDIELPELDFDKGDVTRLIPYLPDAVREGTSGEIEEIDWFSNKCRINRE